MLGKCDVCLDSQGCRGRVGQMLGVGWSDHLAKSGNSGFTEKPCFIESIVKIPPVGRLIYPLFIRPQCQTKVQLKQCSPWGSNEFLRLTFRALGEGLQAGVWVTTEHVGGLQQAEMPVP